MRPRPWWQVLLQFIRECLCIHAWQHDEPFANFRFCPKCEATESYDGKAH